MCLVAHYHLRFSLGQRRSYPRSLEWCDLFCRWLCLERNSFHFSSRSSADHTDQLSRNRDHIFDVFKDISCFFNCFLRLEQQSTVRESEYHDPVRAYITEHFNRAILIFHFDGCDTRYFACFENVGSMWTDSQAHQIRFDTELFEELRCLIDFHSLERDARWMSSKASQWSTSSCLETFSVSCTSLAFERRFRKCISDKIWARRSVASLSD